MGKTEARKAWQINYEKHIAAIDSKLDSKTGEVTLESSLWEWYNTYKRQEVGKGGRPKSARTIQTDEDTIKQICVELESKQVCETDSDVIQQYMLGLIQKGVADSTIRKRWNMLSMFM